MNYVADMKFLVAIFILSTFVRLAPAQTNEPTIDLNAVLDTAQQWAQDNLDEDVLRVLETVDHEKVADFFQNYQEYLSGDSVLDLAQLKANSTTVLPLLDAHEATQPYAAWLRSRLDYFDVAEQLKRLAPPAPKPVPGKPVTPLPNPTFQAEQEIWTTKLAPRPLPKGADKYLPQLKKIFAAEHVPEALVWIAEVESGFDARAKSPAGAAGLFQLMPATAKSYGLSLWPFDERKQVEPAAQAAAQHLRRLYKIFGDWRLVVAAYNCGEGTVQKALQRSKTKTYAAIATRLPAETQMYVPKVEATILHREGLALQKLKTTTLAQDELEWRTLSQSMAETYFSSNAHAHQSRGA
jgi:membrane-bound lytic murein transglycosylase D